MIDLGTPIDEYKRTLSDAMSGWFAVWQSGPGADSDKSWCDAAHTIKGSAHGIGAWGIAAAAVKSRAFRARAHLRELLGAGPAGCET